MGDEILVINGKVISELDMVYIETLLHESRTLFLTIRSFRTKPPVSDFITDHANTYIDNMVCPPPPSQPRITEKVIGDLIVPAPASPVGKNTSVKYQTSGCAKRLVIHLSVRTQVSNTKHQVVPNVWLFTCR